MLTECLNKGSIAHLFSDIWHYETDKICSGEKEKDGCGNSGNDKLAFSKGSFFGVSKRDEPIRFKVRVPQVARESASPSESRNYQHLNVNNNSSFNYGANLAFPTFVS